MHNGAIMPSEVRFRVEADQAFPLVRLTGVLDQETAPEIRSVLLDVLADQPAAVLVDVADLSPDSSGAVETLRDLRRETADWPAARLALCDPGNAGRWRASGWPVWPRSAEAFRSFGSPGQDHRASLELDPVVGAARQTREMLTAACDRWDRADLADPACIVVTEMVNNVVAHARTRMIVLLALRGPGLSVAVRDDSSTIPSFTGAPAPTAYGGRGMLLIDSVATRWGNLPLDHGKVVWALLDGVREESPDRELTDPLPG
jgi:hypothetical protein